MLHYCPGVILVPHVAHGADETAPAVVPPVVVLIETQWKLSTTQVLWLNSATLVAVLGWLLTLATLPETKGKSLEQLEDDAYAGAPAKARLGVQPALLPSRARGNALSPGLGREIPESARGLGH